MLFGHFTDDDPLPVPAGEAAWHLIAQLYYGPSGQCTPRRITTVKPGNGDAGPLRKSVSFHVWASNLSTTLILDRAVSVGLSTLDCVHEAPRHPPYAGPRARRDW